MHWKLFYDKKALEMILQKKNKKKTNIENNLIFKKKALNMILRWKCVRNYFYTENVLVIILL